LFMLEDILDYILKILVDWKVFDDLAKFIKLSHIASI
jgi:hypothetical protein